MPSVGGDENQDYDYTIKPFGNKKCAKCEDCNFPPGNNCIKNYKSSFQWDNFRYESRCRLTPECGGGDDNCEWINKDFTNNTGTKVNDLHWTFSGLIERKIVAVYVPDELPKVRIAGTGAPGTTKVDWEGGEIDKNETVHCGIRVNWGSDEPIPAKRFYKSCYWTSNGEVVPGGKVAGCASVNLDTSLRAIGVGVENTEDLEDPPLEVDEFSYALLETPVELGELTWDNPVIPWVSMPWQGTIPPAGSIDLGTIPRAPCANEDVVITQFAVNFSGDPPENKGHIIVQRVVRKKGIPAVSEWGLVVLTLLLLAAGKICFGRRRQMRTPA